MKKSALLFFACLTLAFLAWSFSIVNPASSFEVLGVTNTPADFTPTSLPTEALTSTPTAQPTNTPEPSLTPTLENTATPTATNAPTATSTPQGSTNQPTPKALPPMGNGEQKPDDQVLGSTVLRIRIPALGLDSVVKRVSYIQGAWDISNLGMEVGWLETTPLPGLSGNTVLVGHLNMKGGAQGPFYHLVQLEPGMEVVVNFDGVGFHYKITQKSVTELTDISPLQQTHLPRLTLVTCLESSWDPSARIYLKRQIIVAELVSIDEK